MFCTDEQVFLDKFTFSCVQSTSFPWQVYFLVCVQSTSFPWQVYFLVYTVNKFFLTSLFSRVYSQHVFLDKFTFSCIQSTSFPWQVYFLVCIRSTSFPWQVYFLVYTVNKFSLTSLLSRVYMQSINKFSLTSLLSRVYSQQVFLDKFTFSCVRSTSFPWQVPLTKFLVRVHGILLNWFSVSHVKAAFSAFVCQNHRSIYTLDKFPLPVVHANKCSLSKNWHA
jgi:hypothetical protein